MQIFTFLFVRKMVLGGHQLILGDNINTEFADAYVSITPDGKYFFFHRSYGNNKADIFWVDFK